ncbi:unnamed protein product [Macrosiphum euphorbiae]|uniref:Uncharacterized protein n=1 Tax=Macrosiphum euphorbiae TaxID=13131 RepID=A0AAV0XWU5_9HEMI|nr:unnamed protein product [Macrosiphum euphorbiae]
MNSIRTAPTKNTHATWVYAVRFDLSCISLAKNRKESNWQYNKTVFGLDRTTINQTGTTDENQTNNVEAFGTAFYIYERSTIQTLDGGERFRLTCTLRTSLKFQ